MNYYNVQNTNISTCILFLKFYYRCSKNKNIIMSRISGRKRNELRGVLLGGNYNVTRKDYDELLFNIECKKLNITPDEMRAIYKEVQKENHKELFKIMGFDKLDKTMQDYILKSIS